MQRYLKQRISAAIFCVSVAICMTAAAAPASNQDQVTYDKNLEDSLRKQWASHGHDRSKHDNPAVDFTIDKDGAVSKVTLEKSSGDPALDAEAIKLVKDMSPLAAPPDGQTDFATIFSDIDFGTYMQNMQRRIKQRWFPPKEQQTEKLAVIFRLAKDGTMSHLKVRTSSGNSLVDTVGMKAVTDASPFDPLPVGSMPVDVAFEFDYNVNKKAPALLPELTSPDNKATSVNPGDTTAAGEPKTAVALNNAGVTLLKQSQFEAAVDVFLQALKVDPAYSIARSNLAIAYNNLARNQADSPDLAISALCKSLYIAPDNATTHQNLHDMLIKQKNFGGTFDDYVRLGNEAAASHKSLNAYVMYHEALRQQADDALNRKAKKLQPAADKELNEARVTQ